MHEAEGMNFKLDFLKKPFTGKDVRRIQNPHKVYTIDEIINFIKMNRNISIDDQEDLIRIAKSTPVGALGDFKKNYVRILSQEKKKRKKKNGK